jgi:hypothetical protein
VDLENGRKEFYIRNLEFLATAFDMTISKLGDFFFSTRETTLLQGLDVNSLELFQSQHPIRGANVKYAERNRGARRAIDQQP